MLSLQIILTEKSLIIKLFSLKISYKQNQDTEVNWKTFTSKEGKRRLGECGIVLIFFGKSWKWGRSAAKWKTAYQAKMSIFVYLTLCKRKSEVRRMRNRTNFFRANHENEVEAQRSEKLPTKQKCQPLFTCHCRKYGTGYKNSIKNNRWL